MGWTVKISDFAEKQLKKLDKQTQKRIINYFYEHLEACKNPRHFGHALKGNKKGLWRYRVGDFRVICEIYDNELIILALAIGHRKEIYK